MARGQSEKPCFGSEREQGKVSKERQSRGRSGKMVLKKGPAGRQFFMSEAVVKERISTSREERKDTATGVSKVRQSPFPPETIERNTAGHTVF